MEVATLRCNQVSCINPYVPADNNRAHPLSTRRTCFYCRVRLKEHRPTGFERTYKPLPTNQRTIDHVVPRKMGGIDQFWNRVWCCRMCNTNKSATLNRTAMERLAIEVRWVNGYLLMRHLLFTPYWYRRGLSGPVDNAGNPLVVEWKPL